ncbi:MAG: type II secretion system secretin GspD [Alphaproteobacteria bacterium]
MKSCVTGRLDPDSAPALVSGLKSMLAWMARAIRSVFFARIDRDCQSFAWLCRASAALLFAASLSACAGFDNFGRPSATAEVTAEEPAAPESSGPSTEAVAEAPGPEPEIHHGTGVFINMEPLALATVETTVTGDVTLNFIDADVREVVRAVLGDILGLNYVIDPAVSGTVTVQTSRPLPRSSLLSTLENVLALAGAALVRRDNFYSIIPLDKALGEAGTFDIGPARPLHGPGYGIQIVPLEFVSAGEMKKILDPITPFGGDVRVDEARNLLIIAGTLESRQNALEAVDIFDVDWLSGMSFGLFPLQFVDPETLAKELETVLLEEPASPLSGMIRFVPIERMNALLVISPSADYVDEAGGWIERLDQTGDEGGRQIYVYPVQNGRAADLAVLLNDIFGGVAPREPQYEVAPGLEPVELRAEPAAEGLEMPAPPSLSPSADAVTLSSEIRVIADEATNSLVILASPADYRMVKAALDQLDILPLQVLIEATIAEVELTEKLKFGLQWFFETGRSTFTLSEVAAGTVDSIFPGFSYFFQGAGIQAALNALSEVTDVNVISSPQVMVLDNQTALLQVGDTVPIATQSAVSTIDPEAPIVNSIEYRDTGVLLTVTPRVNAGGLVIMEIEQEVSDVILTTTSGIDSPTIQERRITSTVAIQSGETVALGGLIRDRQFETETGVPILADIPLLGALFRATNNETKRVELLILITPRVVGSLRDAREVTEELRQRVRSVVPLGIKIE